MARVFQVPVTLHKRQKEIFDDRTRRRIVAAGRRFGKCLVGETKIMMADGSEKELRDLRKGDMITSYDEKTNQYVKRKVRRVVPNGKRAILKVSTEYRHIRCTAQHPFFTQGSWTKAGRLTPRSSLTIFDGSETSFERVTGVRWDGEEDTFDIEVENTPTFIANGIVTHNTALARSEILRAASNPGWNVWYVAPTYRMAKQIMWRDLMREIPRGWIKAANATVMDITLKNGSVISLRGADKPDSLRGVEVNFLVMDEMQDIKPIAWEEALRPTLAKTRGRVLFLGCVAADTQVITAHGAREIGSFDEKNGDKSLTPLNVSVYGIDQSWSEADGFFDNGEVPTRRMITKRGYSLESSLPHPVLVMNEDGEIEWKKTSCLKIGDRVAIDRNTRHGFVGVKVAMQSAIDKEIEAGNLGEGSQFGPNRLYFLGLWTACGEIHGTGRVTVTTREKVLRDYLSRQMNEHGDGFYQSNDRRFRYFCNSSVFVRLMKAACSDWASPPNKRRFPEVIAQARPSEIRSFVAGLIDGAGFTQSQSGYAQYSSTERNCRDLQLLLLRCGIISTVKLVGESWFLFVSGKDASQFGRTFPVKLRKRVVLPEDNDLVYEDEVPFAGGLVEAAFGFKTEDAISYKKLEAMMRFGGKDQVAKKKIERILAQNYFWDEIKSLIVGFRHTYDFTIPATHSFWSNGFISHNTPKMRNYFYKLYKMGQNKDYQRAGIYKSWQIPTIESPFIPEAEIEEARADMDPRSFRQEFMACHLPDTEVIMADGRVKKIKDVGIDDVLVHVQGDGRRVVCVVDAAGITGEKEICDVVLETGEEVSASVLHRFKVHV